MPLLKLTHEQLQPTVDPQPAQGVIIIVIAEVMTSISLITWLPNSCVNTERALLTQQAAESMLAERFYIR